jgi:hypothetical protein
MPPRKATRTEAPLRLMNIGPVSTQWLNEIGVFTKADLEQMGAVMAYRILKHRRPEVSLNLLYGLHAALTGVHWNALSPEEKARLRQDAAEAFLVEPAGALR